MKKFQMTNFQKNDETIENGNENEPSGITIAEQIQIQNTNVNRNEHQNVQPPLWQFPSWKSLEKTWGDFDGTLIQWQGFHDRFKSAVHDNEQIPRAFKFQYLQNSLKGKAAAALGEW